MSVIFVYMRNLSNIFSVVTISTLHRDDYSSMYGILLTLLHQGSPLDDNSPSIRTVHT